MRSNGDRLTNLHDSLLRHIISRLPTKDAVRTSILSKHWKHKWTLSYDVDTDFETWGTPSTAPTFTHFLDEILISREYLTRLRVTFWSAMPDDMEGWCTMSNMVQGWIDAALRHNLEYLDVNLNHNSIAFPISLLNSKSLREIKVVEPHSSSVQVIVEEKNCAPNLTSLSLDGISLVNRNLDSSSISFDFPALERLEFRKASLSYKQRMNVNSVEIYAPSLVSFLFEPPIVYIDWPYVYSTKIVAPRLTSFSCVNGFPENLIFDGSSVVSAFLYGRKSSDIRMIESVGTRATNLLNGFTNLEELTLGRHMSEVLRKGPPLHHHDKLKRLTLLSGCNACQLFKLLHAIPLLKFLSVNVDKWEDYDYEVMNITPSCIASSLEEVVLQVFSGTSPQYNLAALLLKSAKNLQKLTITTNDIGASKEMKENLSAFCRCSPSLAICSRLPDIEPTYTSEGEQDYHVLPDMEPTYTSEEEEDYFVLSDIEPTNTSEEEQDYFG